MIRKSTFLAFLTFIFFSLQAWAGFAPFKAEKIQIMGNERIGEETIRSYLPVDPGQVVTPQQAQNILRALYGTGFFKTAALFRDGNTLIVKVVERPTIADVSITGNSLIGTEDLQKALETLGIKKGRIYDALQLERVALDLKQRYQNRGYYDAKIDIRTEPLPRNRVKVVLAIHEGKPATIGRITFTGNRAFEDATLLRLLSVAPGEQYARDQLLGDLDKVQQFYMNKGYAEFRINSSQVRLAPDRKKVYVTINLHEGPVYHIGQVRLVGDLKLPRAELEKLIQIKSGQRFSRQAIVDSIEALREKYGEHAYANARVAPIPELNPEKRIADITFQVAAGSRVYVRRIIMEGNTRTRDHVIRRELRQLEAAPFVQTALKLSRHRLQKLGYFKSVQITPQPVSKDMVDLHVKVEEQPTGSFTAAVGYSQLDGASFSLGISERNILGSGNAANIKASISSSTKSVDISLVNPYFTPNGVSLGVGLFWNEINADELEIANYTVNTLGGTIFSSIPLSEESSFSYGFKYKRDSLVCGSTFNECNTFVAQHGDTFNVPIVNAGWSYNSTNAFYFPTDGYRLNLSGEAVVPAGTSLGFAKLYASVKRFVPLTRAFTLKGALNIAYGTGYGDINDLPFYERFFAGGIRSVRGYEPNSLGEHYDLNADGTDVAKGGDFKLTGTLALISPFPFIEDSSNLRVSLFYDFGNVYRDISHFKAGALRDSVGVMLNWITPVGPLALSFAKPIHYGDNDRLQQFQFSLGMPF